MSRIYTTSRHPQHFAFPLMQRKKAGNDRVSRPFMSSQYPTATKSIRNHIKGYTQYYRHFENLVESGTIPEDEDSVTSVLAGTFAKSDQVTNGSSTIDQAYTSVTDIGYGIYSNTPVGDYIGDELRFKVSANSGPTSAQARATINIDDGESVIATTYNGPMFFRVSNSFVIDYSENPDGVHPLDFTYLDAKYREYLNLEPSFESKTYTTTEAGGAVATLTVSVDTTFETLPYEKKFLTKNDMKICMDTEASLFTPAFFESLSSPTLAEATVNGGAEYWGVIKWTKQTFKDYSINYSTYAHLTEASANLDVELDYQKRTGFGTTIFNETTTGDSQGLYAREFTTNLVSHILTNEDTAFGSLFVLQP